MVEEEFDPVEDYHERMTAIVAEKQRRRAMEREGKHVDGVDEISDAEN